MFAKLLKHEWKSSAGFLGILSLAALAAGLVGAGIVRFIFGYAMNLDAPDGVAAAIMEPMIVLLGFLVMAIFVYVLSVELLLFYRFYKSRFTDEGYLTFTLPVSSHQIFLSSLVNILIWSVISAAVLVIAAALMVWAGVSGSAEWGLGEIMADIYEFYREGQLQLNLNDSYYILSLVSFPVDWIGSAVQVMTCITIGAVLAKKHKILTAVAFYYLLSMVTNVIFSFLSTMALMARYNGAAVDIALMAQLTQLITRLLLAVGGYFLSIFLMKRKLNLP